MNYIKRIKNYPQNQQHQTEIIRSGLEAQNLFLTLVNEVQAKKRDQKTVRPIWISPASDNTPNFVAKKTTEQPPNYQHFDVIVHPKLTPARISCVGFGTEDTGLGIDISLAPAPCSLTPEVIFRHN
jgi:hypothetical protein